MNPLKVIALDFFVIMTIVIILPLRFKIQSNDKTPCISTIILHLKLQPLNLTYKSNFYDILYYSPL